MGKDTAVPQDCNREALLPSLGPEGPGVGRLLELEGMKCGLAHTDQGKSLRKTFPVPGSAATLRPPARASHWLSSGESQEAWLKQSTEVSLPGQRAEGKELRVDPEGQTEYWVQWTGRT